MTVGNHRNLRRQRVQLTSSSLSSFSASGAATAADSLLAHEGGSPAEPKGSFKVTCTTLSPPQTTLNGRSMAFLNFFLYWSCFWDVSKAKDREIYRFHSQSEGWVPKRSAPFAGRCLGRDFQRRKSSWELPRAASGDLGFPSSSSRRAATASSTTASLLMDQKVSLKASTKLRI